MAGKPIAKAGGEGILVSVDVTGDEAVKRGLAGFANLVKDLRPFWRDEFAPVYFGRVQDGFAMEGQPRTAGGRFAAGRWAPLSPKYKAWKERHYPGKKILAREGDLQASVAWNGGLGPGGVFHAFPRYVEFGTAIPYAIYHQQGTPKMPARPFLPPPDPVLYAPLLDQWIRRNAKARGAKLK
jgi:phage gpG-like protein